MLNSGAGVRSRAEQGQGRAEAGGSKGLFRATFALCPGPWWAQTEQGSALLFLHDPREGGDGLMLREIWSKAPAMQISSEAGFGG